jgi:hypothetical protein
MATSGRREAVRPGTGDRNGAQRDVLHANDVIARAEEVPDDVAVEVLVGKNPIIQQPAIGERAAHRADRRGARAR